METEAQLILETLRDAKNYEVDACSKSGIKFGRIAGEKEELIEIKTQDFSATFRLEVPKKIFDIANELL